MWGCGDVGMWGCRSETEAKPETKKANSQQPKAYLFPYQPDDFLRIDLV